MGTMLHQLKSSLAEFAESDEVAVILKQMLQVVPPSPPSPHIITPRGGPLATPMGLIGDAEACTGPKMRWPVVRVQRGVARCLAGTGLSESRPGGYSPSAVGDASRRRRGPARRTSRTACGSSTTSAPAPSSRPTSERTPPTPAPPLRGPRHWGRQPGAPQPSLCRVGVGMCGGEGAASALSGREGGPRPACRANLPPASLPPHAPPPSPG